MRDVTYYYTRIINWAKLGTKEDFWGTDKHLETCWGMVEEEYNELRESFNLNDDENILDGLCDLFVTIVQVVELSIRLTGRNNFPPLRGMVSIQKFIQNRQIEIIIKERKLSSIDFVLLSLCKVFDTTTYPIEEALNEVLKSNDSKFPTIEELHDQYGNDTEIALQSASDWVESNYGFNNVKGIIKEGKCIFRCDNGEGKIVKPWTFSKPDLKQFIEGEIRDA